MISIPTVCSCLSSATCWLSGTLVTHVAAINSFRLGYIISTWHHNNRPYQPPYVPLRDNMAVWQDRLYPHLILLFTSTCLQFITSRLRTPVSTPGCCERRAYVLPLFHILTISARPIISTFTGPIFTKSAGLIWL